jgi:hypothetical protein
MPDVVRRRPSAPDVIGLDSFHSARGAMLDPVPSYEAHDYGHQTAAMDTRRCSRDSPRATTVRSGNAALFTHRNTAR